MSRGFSQSCWEPKVLTKQEYSEFNARVFQISKTHGISNFEREGIPLKNSLNSQCLSFWGSFEGIPVFEGIPGSWAETHTTVPTLWFRASYNGRNAAKTPLNR